jgi:hypothetical protein
MNSEVQKSVFAALTAANIASVTEIRDTPIANPSTANFPFIEIGAGQVVPVDAGGDTGAEEYLDLHVYSRTGGQRQVKEIMTAIYAVLHQQSLTVSGKASAHCFHDSSRVIDTPDGLTRHGIMTFQIIHRT